MVSEPLRDPTARAWPSRPSTTTSPAILWCCGRPTSPWDVDIPPGIVSFAATPRRSATCIRSSSYRQTGCLPRAGLQRGTSIIPEIHHVRARGAYHRTVRKRISARNGRVIPACCLPTEEGEYRGHPTVSNRLLGETEFGENGVAVLLDGRLREVARSMSSSWRVRRARGEFAGRERGRGVLPAPGGRSPTGPPRPRAGPAATRQGPPLCP